MFRHGGDSRNDLEAAFLRGILHFHKGILISPVSIYADKGAFRTVSCDFPEPLDCHGGSTSSERGHGDQHLILFVDDTLGKIGHRVAQINFDSVFTPMPAKNMGDFLCAACGAENDFDCVHK